MMDAKIGAGTAYPSEAQLIVKISNVLQLTQF